MNEADIACRIARIKASADDPEMAHAEEDNLHVDVLQAIAARRCANPAECAGLALTTLEIVFPRWCA